MTPTNRLSRDGAHSTAQSALYTAFLRITAESPQHEWDALFALANDLCEQAWAPSASNPGAEEDLHRVLYGLHSEGIRPPWEAGWRSLDDWRFHRLRQTIESAWSDADSRRLTTMFGPLPAPSVFADWAQARCSSHRSNVSHPIFDYLQDEATLVQLREFFIQEMPFDIHFGDLVAMMLPGVYGNAKSEMSKNFWDEVGRGETHAMHRQLRLDMAFHLKVPPDMHLDVTRFCLEELRLANMYFHAIRDRSLLPQALGMMLATELMVPGRLERQIEGWRRVGFPDTSMQYLLEHVVVDVEHARGWMDEVVMPLLRSRPDLMHDLVLGMARRLEHAGSVCDRMMLLLPSMEVVEA